MRLWPQRFALIAFCSLASLCAAWTVRAEQGVKGAGTRASVARVDFRVTVPHFLDLRVRSSPNATEAASAVLQKVRYDGSGPLRVALADASVLRIDGVRIASNRGQVMISLRSDESGQSGAAMRDASDVQRFGQRNLLRAVAFAAEGRPLREVSVLPGPNRAGVTQLRTAWLRAYSHEPGLVHAVASLRPVEEVVPPATCVAAVP